MDFFLVRILLHSDQKKLRIWTLFTQTMKLTVLLALTLAARASEIAFLDIRYLIKHSSGYTFHLGKNTKTSKRSKPRDPIKFRIFKENLSVCLSTYWFYLE